MKKPTSDTVVLKWQIYQHFHYIKQTILCYLRRCLCP